MKVLGYILAFFVLYLGIKFYWTLGKIVLGRELRGLESLPARPPDGLSKEVWVSRELGKIEQVIAEAELQAEHDWRIEHGEHEGCKKCIIGYSKVVEKRLTPHSDTC